MGVAQDRAYYRERAIEERDAAAEASCIVRDVHLELAELYEDLGADIPAEAGRRQQAEGQQGVILD